MRTFSLNGAWELRQAGGDTSYPATVPGCVHLDLQAAGVIDDPFYRDNEIQTLWICETDWLYSRTFTVDQSLLACERILLHCEGLDTLASVSINGQFIGTAENMFRTWEFDVKPHLKLGENRIEVAFQAPLPYVREKEQSVAPLYAWGVGHHKLNGGGWLRKQPSNFGWDWGPELTTCGIWRDIELLGIDDARLCDVQILQNHDNGAVSLDIHTTVEQFSSAPLSLDVQVSFAGIVIARQQIPVQSTSTPVSISIPDPKLWFPRGIGDQPLYQVTVQLWTQDGTVIDQQEKRIGLRTLRLVRQHDQWGESFMFAVNGITFFAKGANWIPADTFVTRLTEADYRRLLQAACDVNMNMLRVWGGGIYEPDMFYNLCDELGLCVWQDFMFACSTYPTFDAAFMGNAKAEAEDAVRRIRHHASLALWCGNNELEQGLVADEWTETTMSWADYGLLFDDLLKDVATNLSPQTDYWPSSPHTPHIDRALWRSPDYGDYHSWEVWHARQPFEFYRTTQHRFISEFGFQSFPEPRTVEAYTLPQDRNITSFVMEHHQRSLIGNSTIVHYMTDWFRLPTSFDKMLWLSQILQGLAIKYAVEHWRRNMPRTMGALYWQINDCWPVASWASIDYFGRWKALHYMARRFFASFLVSGVEDVERGTVEIHVTSDAGEERAGTIEWKLTDLDGKPLAGDSITVAIPARATQLSHTLNLADQIKAHGARGSLLWLALSVDGEAVSTNLVTFARPKHLELGDPAFAVSIRQNGNDFTVTLSVERPALYTWLTLSDLDAAYSDNFVHIAPGQPVEITISALPAGTTLADVQGQLQVNSLVDTY